MKRITFKVLWCLGYISGHLSCHFIFPRVIAPGLRLVGGRLAGGDGFTVLRVRLPVQESYLKVFHASNLGKVSHFYLYLVWQQFKAHRKSLFFFLKEKKIVKSFKG